MDELTMTITVKEYRELLIANERLRVENDLFKQRIDKNIYEMCLEICSIKDILREREKCGQSSK